MNHGFEADVENCKRIAKTYDAMLESNDIEGHVTSVVFPVDTRLVNIAEPQDKEAAVVTLNCQEGNHYFFMISIYIFLN